MMLKRFLSFTLLFFTIISYGQISKYSNEFLAIGVGARSLGMGNVGVASVSDVTSTYWNPAGLLLIPNKIQLGYMHNEYFAGIAKHDYMAGTFKIDDSSIFGATIIRMGVDDIPYTIDIKDADGNINYDRISSFSDTEYAFIFSYAKASPIEGLRYGGNVKIIHKKVGSFAKSWGFGIDVAAQYDYGEWVFGAAFKDVTSTFNVWTYDISDKMHEVFIAENNEIPTNSIELTLPKLIIGTGYHFVITEKIGGLAEVNADITFDGKRNTLVKSNFASIDPHFGIEIDYKNIIFFRTGIANMQTIPDFDDKNKFNAQPTLGLGINLERIASLEIYNLSINYALANIGNKEIPLYSNVLSIRFGI